MYSDVPDYFKQNVRKETPDNTGKSYISWRTCHAYFPENLFHENDFINSNWLKYWLIGQWMTNVSLWRNGFNYHYHVWIFCKLILENKFVSVLCSIFMRVHLKWLCKKFRLITKEKVENSYPVNSRRSQWKVCMEKWSSPWIQSCKVFSQFIMK